MSETSQIIVMSHNDKLFNAIKDISPNNYSINLSTDRVSLFKDLFEHSNKYACIIVSPSKENQEFLRQIKTSYKTKTIPVILALTDDIPMDEINVYLKIGIFNCFPENLESNIINSILLATINDRKRYLTLEHDVSLERAALIMNYGIFKLQRLEDCQALATLIANACPNPKLAVIGIAEILINAVEHGNLGISYVEKTKLQSSASWYEEVEQRINLPENKNKYVTVTFERTPDNVRLNVKDEGEGFEWDKFQYFDSSRIYDSHGRGIIMAKNLAFQKLEYLGKGNEVNCYLNISS